MCNMEKVCIFPLFKLCPLTCNKHEEDFLLIAVF